MYFYSSEMLSVIPEFRYDNKLDSFKPKDVEMLVEYLVKKEEYEKQRKLDEAAANAATTPDKGAKGKPDPKKDAKGGKAGAKGAAVAEDKNSPQPITVEYPETDSADNFVIYERKFNERSDGGKVK